MNDLKKEEFKSVQSTLKKEKNENRKIALQKWLESEASQFQIEMHVTHAYMHTEWIEIETKDFGPSSTEKRNTARAQEARS